MARKAKAVPADQEAPEAEAGAGGPDFSLVLPLSLLAGGLAAYPSLSGAAAGEGDLMGSLTLFLTATLVATIGFGFVALLFHSFSSDPGASGPGPAGDRRTGPAPTGTDRPVTEADGPVPTVALNPPPDPHGDAIDTALAPTDALVHDQP